MIKVQGDALWATGPTVLQQRIAATRAKWRLRAKRPSWLDGCHLYLQDFSNTAAT